jgi:hypothetical protein
MSSIHTKLRMLRIGIQLNKRNWTLTCMLITIIRIIHYISISTVLRLTNQHNLAPCICSQCQHSHNNTSDTKNKEQLAYTFHNEILPSGIYWLGSSMIRQPPFDYAPLPSINPQIIVLATYHKPTTSFIRH